MCEEVDKPPMWCILLEFVINIIIITIIIFSENVRRYRLRFITYYLFLHSSSKKSTRCFLLFSFFYFVLHKCSAFPSSFTFKFLSTCSFILPAAFCVSITDLKLLIFFEFQLLFRFIAKKYLNQ